MMARVYRVISEFAYPGRNRLCETSDPRLRNQTPTALEPAGFRPAHGPELRGVGPAHRVVSLGWNGRVPLFRRHGVDRRLRQRGDDSLRDGSADAARNFGREIIRRPV